MVFVDALPKWRSLIIILCRVVHTSLRVCENFAGLDRVFATLCQIDQ